MYVINTKHGPNVTSQKWNHGSDNLIHAKNGTTTVASIPVSNVEGIFRRGGSA